MIKISTIACFTPFKHYELNDSEEIQSLCFDLVVTAGREADSLLTASPLGSRSRSCVVLRMLLQGDPTDVMS